MEYRKISELTTVVTGGTPSTSVGEYWNDGNIPWLQSGCCQNCEVDSTERYITQAGYDNSSARMMPKHTIMIALTGATAGKIGYLNFEACGNQSITGILPCEFLNQRFLFYYLISKRPQILADCVGGAQAHISQGYVKNIKIPMYPLEKQVEVVNVLDGITSIIIARKLELQSFDELIKSRFVEMFGHQSHNEKSLPYMTIDDVAEIYLGITHTPTYVDSGVMFISAKNTSGDFLDLSDVKYISREEFEGAPKGSKPQVNDVLFSRVGSNLGHPVILEEELELCTFVSLGFLRSKENVTSNYLKHWMRDEFFAKQVSEHVKGGGQPNLNTGWLKEFKIIVPDLEEQKAFDDFCKQVDKSKVAVQKSLDETQLLFDSLMQKYFG